MSTVDIPPRTREHAASDAMRAMHPRLFFQRRLALSVSGSQNRVVTNGNGPTTSLLVVRFDFVCYLLAQLAVGEVFRIRQSVGPYFLYCLSRPVPFVRRSF